MTNRSKAKGDRAELEVQALIRVLTGWPARRQLGAGRLDDIGDISGVPDTTIQVAFRKATSSTTSARTGPAFTSTTWRWSRRATT